MEALLIAKRLEQLKHGGQVVFDKQTKQYRPIKWRDMVILLRSIKGKADIMLEALRQRAIPAYAEVGSGYFQETEVQVMLSLLSVIDNPRQDIHLAGVLRSPLVGLTADQLAQIRVYSREGDLWDAVMVAGTAATDTIKPALDSFMARLASWSSHAGRHGVPELVWRIYRDTGYYDYVGGMPGGPLRQANLRALYDRARQYEETNFRGLFRFLRFIDSLKDQGSDLAVARILGESEDVVRVMSIHKSKGLEFPVVVVADLGKKFNLADAEKALVLCHKTLGVGPYVVNTELRFRYPSIARLGLAHKLKLEAKAEELRILYVALTRAREKLILTGSAKNLVKKCTKWSRTVDRTDIGLPEYLIAGANTYLDWLARQYPAITTVRLSETTAAVTASPRGRWRWTRRNGRLPFVSAAISAPRKYLGKPNRHNGKNS